MVKLIMYFLIFQIKTCNFFFFFQFSSTKFWKFIIFLNWTISNMITLESVNYSNLENG